MATQLAKLAAYSYTPAGARAGGSLLNSIASTGIFNIAENDVYSDILGATTNDTNTNMELVPVGGNTKIIDVVRDFDWNGNHILEAYPKFPKVFLYERTQVESSLVSSYYYYISNIINAVNNIDGVTANGNVQGIVGNKAQQIFDKLSEFVSKTAKGFFELGGIAPDNAISRGVSSTVNGFIDFFRQIYEDIRAQGASEELLLGEFLKSYVGIYFTKRTGFVYVLPYFQNKFQGGVNNWSPTSNQPVLQGMVDNLAETYLPLFSPGAYIEQPKYFNFQQTQGDSIELEFPLLNTVSESYKKNYELLWILAFQNKYYRQGFASVRPPKIYTVLIPGVKYFPYAYISNLSIDFAGTRRLLEVETPKGTVEAPIPDAYIVRITLTSLLSDTANAMLTDHFHNRVEVNIDPTPVTPLPAIPPRPAIKPFIGPPRPDTQQEKPFIGPPRPPTLPTQPPILPPISPLVPQTWT